MPIEAYWDEVAEEQLRMEQPDDNFEDGCPRCEGGCGRTCWWHFA